MALSVLEKKKSVWQWLLHVAGWILHPAIACFELPMRAGKADVRFAIWIWHNDPNRSRGKAAALCYVANGGQKVAIISFAPPFIIFGFAWFLGPNFAPGGVLSSCVAAALLATAIAFVGTSLLGLSGLLLAVRYGFRLWIDEDPSLDFAAEFWPPVRAKKNQAPLFVLYPIFMILVFGVMSVPEKWMYHAAASLLLLVPPILWLGHITCARTIEDCYEIDSANAEGKS